MGKIVIKTNLKKLETTTNKIYIYKKFKTYLDDKKIPMKNIISRAADGAPVMMGKKNQVLNY